VRAGLFGAFILTILAAAADAHALTLKGLEPGQVKDIGPGEFAALPHVSLKVELHGNAHVFEGVPMLELLRSVGAPWGDTLTGKDLSDVALVTCQDGYKVAYSLGEIDPGTARGQVLVADRMDGAPLDAHAGPFQVVVEADARPARDARMVTGIQLMRLAAPSR
jgi:hypothetical protein